MLLLAIYTPGLFEIALLAVLPFLVVAAVVYRRFWYDRRKGRGRAESPAAEDRSRRLGERLDDLERRLDDLERRLDRESASGGNRDS